METYVIYCSYNPILVELANAIEGLNFGFYFSKISKVKHKVDFKIFILIVELKNKWNCLLRGIQV